MANLIKNQILKHLSKFVKNLSPSQINISTMKGEGELTDLELNEEVLMELMELPSWLRLSSAKCNRVTIRIQWTKLKSVPIVLQLDEVRVEVETCENLRSVNPNAKSATAAGGGGHYGFVEKVVDGITVNVNSVILVMKSHVFEASFQMSRIELESKSPTWTKADLRMTRIKDTDKGEVLNFKELSWQTLRIEAKSTKTDDLTPLRLITQQARCRITIKKKIADCAVLGCRLVIILDDILWGLTDDQLKAALHFADSLSGLLKRATAETQKVKGARKLQSLAEFQKSKETSSKKKNAQTCAAAKVFARYDVVETSYHFYSDRIELHLCDDPDGKGRSRHPNLSEGGAFQISLSKLQVDVYPYHLADSNRSAWIRYSESVHSTWLNNSIIAFQNSLLEALTSTSSSNAPGTGGSSSNKAPLSRSAPGSTANGDVRGSKGMSDKDSAIRETILSQYKKLLTTNLVLRLSNICMWKVSTTKAKSTSKEFISGTDKPPLVLRSKRKTVSGDCERFSLPDDMPVFHFEYTQFYYPGDIDFPLPAPKFFAYINPIQISVDPITCLWLNAFALNLGQSVKKLADEKAEPPYLDVKIEAIMFRIIMDAADDAPEQKDRPKSLHLQVSRVLAANYRSLETGSKADLAETLETFQKSSLYYGTDFPNCPTDLPTVCDKLLNHATGQDSVSKGAQTFVDNRRDDIWRVMKKDLLWTEAKDVWYLHLDPVWADFHGTPSSGSRPVPLVDAFPITLWLYKKPDDEDDKAIRSDKSSNTNESPQADMYVIGSIKSLISVQLNHYQLLFLLRTVEMISEITMFLAQDVHDILGEEEGQDDGSVVLGITIPQVDLSLLMPSIHQSRDSIGGDYDSTVPDSTSVYSAGDLLKGAYNWPKTNPGEESDTDGTLQSQSDLLAEDQSEADSPTSFSNPPSFIDDQTTPSFPKVIQASTENITPTTSTPSTPRSKVKPKHLYGTMPSPNSLHIRSKSPSGKKHSLTSSISSMKASLDYRNTTPTDEESVSIRSDGSSESDNFVFVGQSETVNRENFDAALFNIHAPSKGGSPVEVAMEVTEEALSVRSAATSRSSSARQTPQPPSLDAVSTQSGRLNASESIIIKPQREGMISVATFHVGRLEIAHQSVSGVSAVKIQGASLSGEECPSIPWDEFQSKFTLRGKCWSESTRQPPSSWCFRLRFTTKAPMLEQVLQHGSQEMSLREKISRAAEAFIHLKAQNLPLQFYISTLSGLGDLFEDEIIPSPIPMKIQLDNIALHLIEDRPSPNITSPGSLPIDVAIPALTITRDKSGLFSIQPSESNVKSEDSVAKASIPEIIHPTSSSSMNHHLDLVRSGVASIETELQQRAALLAVDNSNLRSSLDIANVKIRDLSARLQDAEQNKALEAENEKLKETLKYLQKELVRAGKKV
ncbi:bridge-like lipid transfer protein family member 3B isoform X2 [Tigriopus californicus]|uniref:bridge-like lipid transfer protein family member 3B isoform X2 n=1 Tax=Tigriopus californicus TaxID=6832 RepID=UPI0027DA7145|nr:bridge-like lipid transfer protein family member 3B isoform X2 [Tigriopus californicus]